MRVLVAALSLCCLTLVGAPIGAAQTDDPIVHERDTDAVLSRFGLGSRDQGRGAFSRFAMTGQTDDTSTFEDVTFAYNGSVYRAEQLDLVGARIVDGTAQLDALVLTDVEYLYVANGSAPEEAAANSADGTLRVGRLVMSDPGSSLTERGVAWMNGEQDGVDFNPFVLDYGLIELNEFEISIITGQPERTDNYTIGMDRLAFGGSTPQTLGSFTMEGLDVDARDHTNPLTASLSTFSATGLSKFVLSEISERDAPSQDGDFPALPGHYLAFILKDSYTQLLNSFTVRDLQVTTQGMNVSLEALEARYAIDGEALDAVWRLDGLLVAPDLDESLDDETRARAEQFALLLALLGLDEIDISFVSDVTFTPSEDRLVLNDFAFEMANGLDLRASFDVLGGQTWVDNAMAVVPVFGAGEADLADAGRAMAAGALEDDDATSNDEEFLSRLLRDTQQRQFALQIVDRGFTEQFLIFMSFYTNTSASDYRDGLVIGVEEALVNMPQGRQMAAFTQAVVAAVDTYVNAPGALTITIEPDESVDYTAFRRALTAADDDPAGQSTLLEAFLATLNFSIQAEPSGQ